MTKFRRFLSELHRDERGQTIVVFVFMFVVLMGFTAMVSDAGIAYWNRRILQNAMDGAALAGGSAMLGASPATSPTVYAVAKQYAAANGVTSQEIDNVTDPNYKLQVTAVAVNGNNYPEVIVSARRRDNFGLRYFVGAGNSDIVASAAVILAPVPPQPGDLLPFAVLSGTDCSPTMINPDGTSGCEIKTSASNSTYGNFGPVAYPNNPLCNGNDTNLQDNNAAGCYYNMIVNGFQGNVTPTLPSSWFQTDTGNQPNGTAGAVAALFSEDQQYLCDGVFTLSGNKPQLTTTGTYCGNTNEPYYVASPGAASNPDPYNPVTPDGRVCYSYVACPRVGIIPVIQTSTGTWPSGSQTVTVVAYKCFYISNYGSGSGNLQYVSGFFIDGGDQCVPRSTGTTYSSYTGDIFSTGQVGVFLWR